MNWGDILKGGAGGAAGGSIFGPVGSLVGGGLGALGGYFGGKQSDAYSDAAKKLQEYFQKAMAMEKPYIDSGTNQIPTLNNAENSLLNPADLESQWASTYQESPFAKQLQDQAKASGLDAASSQGLLGSSAALNNIQTGATNIMNADRNQYMQDLMDKYMKGIGIGSDMYRTGAATASTAAGQTTGMGEDMARAKYGEESASSTMFQQMMNQFLKAAIAKYGPRGSV